MDSARELVRLANRSVPMATAARLAGLSMPDVYRDSGSKVFCPWGEFSHPDGGAEPAFRVYYKDAWCFACQRFFTPVSLTAEVWDVTREQAAVRLLDAIGHKPADYAHHWQQAAALPELDKQAVAQALRNYCSAVAPPGVMLAPRVAEYLARCLGFLTQVNNEDQARQWLADAKKVMGLALRGEQGAN